MISDEYSECRICPRNCGTNRHLSKGFCLGKDKAVINRTMLHKWEEPYICYGEGSGAVFFSGCQLKCVFCQNYEISSVISGKEYGADEIKDIFLALQNDKKACNVNLVTATPYLPTVREAIIKAKEEGLRIPVVFNSGGYEKVEELKKLNGLIDVYLPDMKYYSPQISEKYSKCSDYFAVAVKALEEMINQVGKPVIENGIMKKGVIVRHLVLPSHKDDSMTLIGKLKEKFGTDSFVLSLMSQFIPMHKSEAFPELSRKITSLEYKRVTDFAEDAGFEFILTQSKQSADISYVPDFSGNGKGENI